MNDKKRWATGIGFVAGLCAVVLLSGLMPNGKKPAVERQAGPQMILGGGSIEGPLPGGTQTTLSALSDASPIPVLRPETDLASDETVSGVWVRSSPAEVWIAYASGIQISDAVADSPAGTLAFYKTQMAEGVPGSIQTVGSYEAFVVPGDKQGDTASVDMVIGDTDVTIYGPGPGPYDTDSLVSLAASVANNADAQGAASGG